jgi:hypothetical protein
MGIAGNYDDPRIWSALERICLAAKSASTPTHQVYVGLGGLEPRPDLLERLRGAFDNIRYVMAGRDTSILLSGMKKQAEEMRAIGNATGGKASS